MCPGPTQAEGGGVMGGEGGLREVGGDRGKKEGGRRERERDRNNSRQGQTEARPQCASAAAAAAV